MSATATQQRTCCERDDEVAMKRSLHPAAPSRYSQKQRNGFVNQASTAFKD
jgi:hypothetical protein